MLRTTKKTTKKKKTGKAEADPAYSRKKAAARKRNADASKRGRDVGPLPAVADPERKLACMADLELFNLTYFPARFTLPFGKDQRQFIQDQQRVILEGGQEAKSLPRGSGKTTLCETGAIWAVAYGHRRFVALIGATQGKAEEILDNIKAEIELNELLAADFPELCHAVVMLEGINNRANGQLLDGKRTRIEWTGKTLVFPTVDGSPASGAIITAEGITGAIRGMSRRAHDGKKVRPDLVIVDDPQTDESARSLIQNDTREAVLTGAVLGLAGPDERIAAIMTCTPIRPNDMADRILDRQRHPEWHGQRSKLLDSMPENLEPWEVFAELLRDGLRADPPNRGPATAYYGANREEMDFGASASWPERMLPGQLSAIQYAMEIFLIDPRTFFAEYQCSPVQADDDLNGAEPLDPSQVMSKLNRQPRGEVPAGCTRLTCGIDVQQEIIYWLVCAWDEDFNGHVVEYGTFPHQTGRTFSAADPSPTLSELFPKLSLEARIYAGLEHVARNVLLRQWPRVDGEAPSRIGKAIVDTGYLADTVHQWARQSVAANIITPSKGIYIGATKTPFSEWKKEPHTQYGQGFRVKAAPNAKGRLCHIDTNHWKNWTAERIRSEPGTKGSLYLFGADPGAHAMFADHCAAERPRRIQDVKTGRTVDEWELGPGRPENHWWDCLNESAVAAGVTGLRWSAGGEGAKTKKPRRSYSQQYDDATKRMEARGRAPIPVPGTVTAPPAPAPDRHDEEGTTPAPEAPAPAPAPPPKKKKRSYLDMYNAARDRERNRGQ